MAKVRNGFTDPRTGYTVERFLCENAPTNHTRPAAGLEGHGYERWSWDNDQAYSWIWRTRKEHCPKCGGNMLPIDQWVKLELETIELHYQADLIGPLRLTGKLFARSFKGITVEECDNQARDWAVNLSETFHCEVDVARAGEQSPFMMIGPTLGWRR